MRLKIGHIILVVCVVITTIRGHAFRRRSLSRRGRLMEILQTTTPPPRYNCFQFSVYDPSSNWCYGTYCDSNDQPVRFDNFNCYSTTVTPTPTPPTTIPPGCFRNGQYYAPGTTIEKGEDRGSNWCWVVLCDSTGTVIHGDDFNCFSTTTPPTTIPAIPDVAGK